MDIVDKVRRRRRKEMARLAREGLTAESLYEKVVAAFRTPGVQFMGWGQAGWEPLDFGPLPTGPRALDSGAYDAAPPRSGGLVYRALHLICEFCLEYPGLMAALEGEQVARGNLEEAYQVLGTLQASHIDLRECWYDACRYVGHWKDQLQWAVFTGSRLAVPRRRDIRRAAARWARRFVEEAAELRMAVPTEAERATRRAAWQAVLNTAGMPSEETATWLSDASLQLGAAAGFYATTLQRLATEPAPDLCRVLSHVYRLEVAGNELCARSATLFGPAYTGLYYGILELSTA